MPVKEININNSYYKVVCKEGQEQDLDLLADKLNSRIKKLKQVFQGKYSELTLLVLIALDLEDRLAEKEKEFNNIMSYTNKRINKITKIFDLSIKK
ncbi:MAG: cell division protein ZapA [Rickettsiaceae bacterium H1]|nr:cell division protein ZapA [Rickettsiaceae bacterium H1]